MASNGSLDLPVEMLSFVLRHGEHSRAGLRLGQLIVQGRPVIPTPALVVPTSRGVVPHVTQDILSRSTSVSCVYIGLEDFIEKSFSKAPIFNQPSSTIGSRLRDFVALPERCISILGPRRIPPVDCPNQNSNSAVAICTSVGFQSLDVDDYQEGAKQLNADITVSVADIVTAEQVSQKRMEKSADRTHAWMRDTLTSREVGSVSQGSLFASIPLLDSQQQSFYLSDLCDEYQSQINGITVYSPESTAELPESLKEFPRLCLMSPQSPSEILRTVELSNDLITVPFATDASENGIALTFAFGTSTGPDDQPLGFDLWEECHTTNVSSLVEDCECYTCTRHHRAYIHHLLTVKEMLAWTLLQIHNLHVMETFFQRIRESIADGSFSEKSARFRRMYETDIPQTSGLGPRVRGYQMKSVGGGEQKKNQKAYGRLEEHARKLEEAESGVAAPEQDAKAEELELQGLGSIQSKSLDSTNSP